MRGNLTGEDIIVKEPKTTAGDRYVYFSAEMESLLREYRAFCEDVTEQEDERALTLRFPIYSRFRSAIGPYPNSTLACISLI